MSDNKITLTKDTLYGVVIVLLVALLTVSVLTQGFGIVKTQTITTAVGAAQAGTIKAAQQAKPTTAVPTTAPSGNSGSSGSTGVSAATVTSMIDGDMSMGSKSAKVVLIEFSDLQCPFCRKFWTESFSQIKKDYIDTGKVQYVFRDFPLSFHAAAQKAAEAVECAEEQGKAWEMHDKIYAEQNKKGVNTVQFTVTDIKSWASGITGLDSSKFNSCLDSGKYYTEVQKDLSDGAQLGVSGTPAFIIVKRDGSKITSLTGAQPYSTFKSTIDGLLQ